MRKSVKTRKIRGGTWLALAVMFLFCLLSGCGRAESGEEPGDGEGGRKLKVAATLFPYYDFVRQVGGDQVDAVEEEIVEGMEHSDEGHGHVHVHGDGEEEAAEPPEEDESRYEIEYDEHIWTSPVNAMRMVDVIAEILTERDPDHGAMYQAGAAAYLEELERLDKEFREVRDGAAHDMIVMGDKFPLRYFADAYGLRYRAAFSGCSSDTEPSARTIAYLIDKVKEEGLPVVYYLELSSHRVAEIIGEETGAVPLLFHSCHNVTRRQFEEGVTYLELMEQNVKNLREGLCK